MRAAHTGPGAPPLSVCSPPAWPGRPTGVTFGDARAPEEMRTMPVTEINHYFVRANDLERTKQFYCEVLGFEVMPRPDFPFPGYWLGVNGKIQVHMGPHGVPNSELYYLGTSPKSATDNSGVVDHIAFLATDPEKFAQRFDAVGLAARRRYFPEFQLFQMFVKDPNGLTIELNFFGITEEPKWGGQSENYAAMPRVAETAK
jgi:catechol 2,3-dioxygenase-like lactoylglutathione lyase family enzyme